MMQCSWATTGRTGRSRSWRSGATGAIWRRSSFTRRFWAPLAHRGFIARWFLVELVVSFFSIRPLLPVADALAAASIRFDGGDRARRRCGAGASPWRQPIPALLISFRLIQNSIPFEFRFISRHCVSLARGRRLAPRARLATPTLKCGRGSLKYLL